MSLPLVSVVLPTFNREGTLLRAVRSVLSQTYRHAELIVVDDGSTDGTSSLLASIADERLRYLKLPSNGGVGAARNAGLRAASGEFVAFQDSDDEWASGKLEAQVQVLRDDPTLALVCCAMIRFSQRHPESLFRFPTPAMRRKGMDARRCLRQHLITFTQTWLARRSVLLSLGGFDERLRVWDDWDLALRLSEQHGVRQLPDLGVISYQSEDGIGLDSARRVHDLEQFVKKYAGHDDRAFVSRLHYLLGRFYRVQGRSGPAFQHCLRAVRMDPVSAKAWAAMPLTLFGVKPSVAARR